MRTDALRAKGWTVTSPTGPFKKGEWVIDFDTSHWMIVSSRSNPRVFDIPVPDEYHTAWTVNLIEHLCQMEDEGDRLRTALKSIRDSSGAGSEARAASAKALERCYHRWLVDMRVPEGQVGRAYCISCGCAAVEPKRADPGAAPDRRGT
jgi:hypothetical protein